MVPARTNERTTDVVTTACASFVFGIVRGSRLRRMTNAVVVVVDRRVSSSTAVRTAPLLAAPAFGITATAASATAMGGSEK